MKNQTSATQQEYTCILWNQKLNLYFLSVKKEENAKGN